MGFEYYQGVNKLIAQFFRCQEPCYLGQIEYYGNRIVLDSRRMREYGVVVIDRDV